MTRVDAKSSLLNALDNAFPATGFAEFLQTALPEIDTSEMDVEESLSWQGILARYLCAVFAKFNGLFPLEIPLHIGQHNAVSQALLLASLQATRTVKAYYDTDLQAAAQELKESIEGVTPGEDGNVTVDPDVWEQIYYKAGEILQTLGANPDAIEDTKDLIQIAQVLTDTIINNFIDIASDTAPADALSNVKSLARWLATQLGVE